MNYINNPHNFNFLAGITIMAIFAIVFLATALFYEDDDCTNIKQMTVNQIFENNNRSLKATIITRWNGYSKVAPKANYPACNEMLPKPKRKLFNTIQ